MSSAKRGKIFPMEDFKPAKLFDADGDLSQRWFVFYYFRNPESGKYERFREMIPTSLKTRSDRYAKGKDLKEAMNKRLLEGFNPFVGMDPSKTNILDAIIYLDEIKSSLRKRTRDTYSCLLRRFKEFLVDKKVGLSSLTVDEFNYIHAQKFMDYYKKEHKVTNRTYNYAVIHMRTFFNLLIEREWLQVNPFKKVKTLPVEETEIVAFTDDELKILRENLPGYNYDLYIVAGLIYYCFLRPAEIMRLQVYHFHVDEGYISVPANVSKNKKQNTIDIPDNFIEELKQLDLNHPPTVYVFARHLKRGEKEAAPTRIAGYWREFANEFGIAKNIYSLKHTGNGRASEMGISARDLQLHNRHSNLDMTQRYLDRFSKKVSTKVVKNFPKM